MLHASTMMPGKVSAMGKVYEEVAALAYQRVSKEAFQWLPQWVISLMGMYEAQAEPAATQAQSSLYQDRQWPQCYGTAGAGAVP